MLQTVTNMRRLIPTFILFLAAALLARLAVTTTIRADAWEDARVIAIAIGVGLGLAGLGFACLNAVQTRAAQGQLASSLGISLVGLVLLALAAATVLYGVVALVLLIVGQLGPIRLS